MTLRQVAHGTGNFVAGDYRTIKLVSDIETLIIRSFAFNVCSVVLGKRKRLNLLMRESR